MIKKTTESANRLCAEFLYFEQTKKDLQYGIFSLIHRKVSNFTYAVGMDSINGIFPRQARPGGLRILTVKMALKLGSSKHGKACLAWVA